MSKREKIILMAMAVAVLFGTWEFFVPKTATRATAGKADPAIDAAFVTQMNETVKQLSASQSHEHIMQQATRPWADDPFGPLPAIVSAEPKILPETAAPRQPKIAYTGFVTVGEKTLAIVNGIEYESGETIEPGGLVIETILPTRIVLKASGQDGTLTIPLEDID